MPCKSCGNGTTNILYCDECVVDWDKSNDEKELIKEFLVLGRRTFLKIKFLHSLAVINLLCILLYVIIMLTS